MGATSTDHGHPTARTLRSRSRRMPAAARSRARRARSAADEAEPFRGQMLTEMARMSLDDGLVMQIHPGSFRNHNPRVFRAFGRDKGADIPTRTDYVRALKPLLDRFGNERDLTIILFTLDETQLLARARAARRPLSGAEARPAVVVPRQPRRHAALSRAGDRDRGLLQHRRLQRRHARVPVDSGAARRRAPRSTAASSRRSSSSTGSARTRRSSSRRSSRTGSRSNPIDCRAFADASVIRGDTYQHEHSDTNAIHERSVDRDARFAHALRKGSHRLAATSVTGS